MRITVDAGTCVGSGQCVMTAPDLFDQHQEDGSVVLLHAEPPPGSADGARTAAALCPVSAIRLHE